MITSLTLAVSLSCNISVAGIKQSVCTSEQSEVEYLMWLYAQEQKKQRQSREQKQEAK